MTDDITHEQKMTYLFDEMGTRPGENRILNAICDDVEQLKLEREQTPNRLPETRPPSGLYSAEMSIKGQQHYASMFSAPAFAAMLRAVADDVDPPKKLTRSPLWARPTRMNLPFVEPEPRLCECVTKAVYADPHGWRCDNCGLMVIAVDVDFPTDSTGGPPTLIP